VQDADSPGLPEGRRYDGGVEQRSGEATASRLTARGAKTRSRIIATAADLMRVRGVAATTLDDVVVASNVSKSQLYRHFEDKQALVRAVIEFVGDRRIADERERLGKVTTFAGLRRWRDALVEKNALHEGRYGCALGSFANEVADQDAIARQKLNELFAAWHELFEDVLRRFQEAGLVPPDADAITPEVSGPLRTNVLVTTGARMQMDGCERERMPDEWRMVTRGHRRRPTPKDRPSSSEARRHLYRGSERVLARAPL
jgi:AcrR family transcriptional regulator